MAAFAQAVPDHFPVEVDGQWGYIDARGEVVIEPQFDEAAFFSDGLARVQVEGTYRFIDTSGTVVLEPEGLRYVGSFSEGRAVASPAGSDSLGYIDKSGAFVVAPRFAQAFDFSEGLAAVDTDFGSSAQPSFGYIDRNGALVIEPQFWGARRFSEGKAPVQTGGFVDGRWGYVNPDGEIVIEPQFDEALPFSDGLAAVDTGEGFDDAWGYIDEKGTLVIEPEFQMAQAFSEGQAPVEDAFDNWRYIDRSGEYVRREEYGFAEPFRGPLARVAEEASPGYGHQGGTFQFMPGVSEWCYIDREGRQVWPKAPAAEAASEERLTPEALEAFLPAALPGGLTRTDVQSGLNARDPFAAGRYEGEAGRLRLGIDHLSGLRRIGTQESLEHAASREGISRQSYRGHSLYEGPAEGGSAYQLVVFTGRFMVRLDGNLSAEEIRAALGALDLDRLEALASE